MPDPAVKFHYSSVKNNRWVISAITQYKYIRYLRYGKGVLFERHGN